MTARTVTERLTARVIDQDTTSRIRLEYRPAAPYEVRAVIESTEGETPWLWSREVLMTAAAGGAWGVGDVWMWAAGNEVMIRLDSPEASPEGCTCVVLALPLPAVRRFLARAHALVPTGGEAEHLGLDAALRALLDAGA